MLPYITNTIKKYKEFYEESFSQIIIPEVAENSYYKSAITKRNRWMVDNSDILIVYVRREYGGAFDTMNYAKKQGKKIIMIK